MEHCFGNNIKSKMGILNLIRKNNYTQNLKILALIGTEKSVTEILPYHHRVKQFGSRSGPTFEDV